MCLSAVFRFKIFIDNKWNIFFIFHIAKKFYIMKSFEFNFYNPVRVVFGAGKLDILGEETAKIGRTALSVLRNMGA